MFKHPFFYQNTLDQYSKGIVSFLFNPTKQFSTTNEPSLGAVMRTVFLVGNKYNLPPHVILNGISEMFVTSMVRPEIKRTFKRPKKLTHFADGEVED